MKKVITIFCISMSFILCGIMVNKNFSLSDEVNTMTMTELYESGASSAKDMVITIESKEERKTDGSTFCLTKDIYWSDYEFRYNEKSDRKDILMLEQ